MSLNAELSAGFTEAQSLISEATGRTGEKNTTYNGGSYIFIYGNPTVERQMLPSGGYRQRTVVPFTVTRTQLDAPPKANEKVIRTDLSPQITYTVVWVEPGHDAYHFKGNLLRTGEVAQP